MDDRLTDSKLFVVACVRNRPITMLEKWAKSLDRQSESPYVALVSYGSDAPHSSQEHLLARKFVFFYREILRNTEPFRQGRGLNVGLRLAMHYKVPIVCFLNVDGLYEKNFCEEIVAEVERTQGVVCCERYDLDQNGHSEPHTRGQAYIGDCIALPTQKAAELGGFDEFYRGWGDVDLDFVQRCTDTGMQKTWVTAKTRMWHQWHEPASKEFTPENSEYRNRMRGVLVRNEGIEWGRM